jgi:hypothetical protein
MAQLDLDRVLQGLTKDFQQFRTSFTQATTSFQKTLVSAESTVKSIVQTAGGSAFSTFTGSIQIVGLQLARFFTPTVVMASKSLQDMADWLGDLTPEGRKSVTALAEFVGAAAVTAGVMRLLGIRVDGTTLAFGALLVAMQAFMDWLDKRIAEADKHNQETAAKQFTHADIKDTEMYKHAAGLGMEERRAYLQREIDIAARNVKELEKTNISSFGFSPSARQEAIDSAERRRRRLMAIREELVFGAKPVESVAGHTSVPLGGGAGIGGLLQMFGLGDKFKELLAGFGLGGGGQAAASGGGRRPFRFDYPTELQPRFSAVEEARKQFQLQALKSPLEQELLRLQRQAAQDVVNEKEKRNKAYDVLADLKSFFGFR